MHVQIQHSIVTQNLVDVFAHRIAKESIAINACRIRMDIRIRKDANYVIVIMVDQLGNHVICIADSVFVVKDLRVVDVTNVLKVSLIILDANDVIVIIVVQCHHQMPVNRFHAMNMDNVCVKHW